MTPFIDDTSALADQLQSMLVGHRESVSLAALLSLAAVIIENNPHPAPPEVLVLLELIRFLVVNISNSDSSYFMRES